jgi:hypothetical protein
LQKSNTYVTFASMKLKVILEPGDGEIWGRCDAPHTHITTIGKNVQQVKDNVKALVQDHIMHEGKNQIEWQGKTIESIEFDYVYDLKAFFEAFTVVKVIEVATLAGINQSLMRQYASGVKYPKIKQVKKIQIALNNLGDKLVNISFE